MVVKQGGQPGPFDLVAIRVARFTYFNITLVFGPITLTFVRQPQCHGLKKGLQNANIIMFAMFPKTRPYRNRNHWLNLSNLDNQRCEARIATF